jgi:hypothetical protein
MLRLACAESISRGRSGGDSGAKGTQSFGSHNMILPILTVTFGRLRFAGHITTRDKFFRDLDLIPHK